MRIFIDTADLGQIAEWLNTGIIDGVTTNPTLLKKAGFTNSKQAWKEIIGLISLYTSDPLPLSAEVFCDDPEEMYEQATSFVKEMEYDGLVIKIPILGTDGANRLAVIRRLSLARVAVNCTGCMTWFQAFCAAKAGAKYVSLLYRRILDAGQNGLGMFLMTRKMLDKYHLSAEIIAGSIRRAQDVFDTHAAGAHIVTIPPKFFPQLLFHQKSVDTQKQFLQDAGVVK